MWRNFEYNPLILHGDFKGAWTVSGRGGARPGAGRKARDGDEKRRQLSTTISVASWEKLRALAASSGMTLSRALDALIAQSTPPGHDGPAHEEGDRP